LIAGGIGITPVASMAAALKSAGRAFELHYSGRSRDQLAFLPELQALAGDALVPHADDDASCRFDLKALLDAASPRQHLYVCGPKGL
ncbi:oxidoreductase, partial [Burkholderia sp. SIMBA_013]